ncbi:MAG: VOC family protein [Chloroflexi bacterium]|nr:VOC family protein [Chloroflexota bacterium]
MPISLQIDHVTIAGSALAPMEQAFAVLGLQTEYGGPHSNGSTHMALLGFEDGSYIELISSLEPGLKETIFWGAHIVGNGGPCAWAVHSDDVAAEAARVAALNVAVEGPVYMNRRRPDGKLVEWDLAFLGDQGAGATLPFVIKDITPREWRVQPSASVAGRLVGVAMVILGVENLEAAIDLFRRMYGWPAPHLKEDNAFKARLAYFEGTPVTLAAPLAQGDWLAERLARFGESPCAYLLNATDFETACHYFDLTPSASWLERRLAWFDPAKLNGVKLGVIA